MRNIEREVRFEFRRLTASGYRVADTSNEVLEAIAVVAGQVCVDPFNRREDERGSVLEHSPEECPFCRVWAEPTDEEKRQVIAKIIFPADEEILYWGNDEVKKPV